MVYHLSNLNMQRLKIIFFFKEPSTSGLNLNSILTWFDWKALSKLSKNGKQFSVANRAPISREMIIMIMKNWLGLIRAKTVKKWSIISFSILNNSWTNSMKFLTFLTFEIKLLFQFLTMFHRRKLSEDDVKINTIFPKICEDLIQVFYLLLWTIWMLKTVQSISWLSVPMRGWIS